MKLKQLLEQLNQLTKERPEAEIFVNTRETSISGEIIQSIESISEGDFGIYINFFKKEKSK